MVAAPCPSRVSAASKAATKLYCPQLSTESRPSAQEGDCGQAGSGPASERQMGQPGKAALGEQVVIHLADA